MTCLLRDAHELSACVRQCEPHLTRSVTSLFLPSLVSLLLLLPLFLTLQSSETIWESMYKKDSSSCCGLNFLSLFILFYFVFVVTVEVVKEEDEEDEEDDENDKEEKDKENSKSDSSEREEL